MSLRFKSSTSLALLAVLTLVVTACGGGAAPAPAATQAAAVAPTVAAVAPTVAAVAPTVASAAATTVAEVAPTVVAAAETAAPAVAPTVAAAATQAGAAASGKPLKIGLIVATGGLGDKGFNDSGYAGVKMAEEQLGITFDVVEPKEIAEYEGHERAFAQKGDYDLIVGLGFDQADPMSKVAKEFPDQKWLLIDGVVADQPNVRALTFKDYEKTFLIGGFAGQLTKEGALPKSNAAQVIGGVGGMDIPLIRAFAAGYSAGARYVNPDVKVVLNYVGGWADPSKGREIALSMYSQEADIVYAFAGGSGLGVFKGAADEDMYAIGADVNQNVLDPEHIVVSSRRKLDTAIFDTIKALQSGEFEAGHHSLGLADNAVDYTLEGSNVKVPQAAIDKVEQMKAKVVSGAWKVPSTLEEVDAFVESIKGQ